MTDLSIPPVAHADFPNAPNFFIVGAQKAGTTRLHFLLGQHPDIWTTSPKEPFWWRKPNPTPRETAHYLALFENANGARWRGESSTAYSVALKTPYIAPRFRRFDPEIKIVYLVRHPLRRMESAWVQGRSQRGEMPRDFDFALRRDIHAMVERTRYWKQLSHYRTHFPDSQILLLFFEDMIADEAATVRRVCDFLGADPNFPFDLKLKDHNPSDGKLGLRPFLDAILKIRGGPRVLNWLLGPNLRRCPRVFLEPISKPKWKRTSLDFVRGELQDDTRALLEFAGKPADFYSWDENASDEDRFG